MSSGSGSDAVLTLAQAAEELGVTPQRVSQMLSTGDLQGPELEPGRTRASKDAGRVWAWSVRATAEERRRRHASSARGKPASGEQALSDRVVALERRVAELASGSPSADAILVVRERAARQAAQMLKVAADAASEALEAERIRTASLEAEVSTLRRRVAELETQADADRTMRHSYSEALTQLLGANDATEL